MSAQTLITVAAGERQAVEWAAQSPICVVVNPNGHLQLIERQTGVDTRMDITLHAGATLEHVRLVNPDVSLVNVQQHVRQQAGSVYNHFFVHNGRCKTTVNISVVLEAEMAACSIKGLTLATEQDVTALNLVVDHAAPNCTSTQAVRSILGGSASSLFEGRIRVRKGADGTQASQSNPNLVLSQDAVVQTRPQLEIDADDVKCSHGATVGQLDENAVFYMRSRGVAEPNARAMMTFGFAAELLETMPIPALQGEMNKNLALFVRNTLGLAEEPTHV